MSKEGGWKRFHKLSFDRKQLSKQALRAEALTKRHAHKFVLQRLRALRDARQYIATWILIVTVLIAAVAVQMTWHQSKYITQAAINGGTYAEATEGPIDTLNPLYATTSAELSANRLLFSQLFDYDNTGHLRSDAAKSITLDEMQKIYTVTLRNDILWHDGTKMTADDVVFTVQSMKNPEVRSVMRNNWKDVTVKKADELTVQFVLPAPYATFPHALTFSILPQHLLSSIQPGALRESAYSVAPVGSGPFKMRLLQTVPNTKDSQKIVHMTAWDKYYRGAPKLSRFELHAYDQQESLAHALSSGDVNAAAGLLFSDDVPQRFITDNIPLDSGVLALFNTKSTTLSDTTIRKALQLGTDTEVLRKKVGVADLKFDLPFVQSQLEPISLPTKPKVDIVAAKELLEKSGWKLNGDKRVKGDITLQLKVVAIKDVRYKVVIDELIRQWKQLGIGVESIIFDPSISQQSFAQVVLQPRMYDVLINELLIGGDGDIYAYWHSSQAQASGYNFSNYQNGISDDTLSSARVRNDPALKAKKYVAFAEQWLKDAPAIGLFQSSMRYAHTKTVSSLWLNAPLPTSIDRYSNVLYWTAERGQVYKTP